jgi:peptidoglycan hydrolase-like protein with peptidoglycan-binding domain
MPAARRAPVAALIASGLAIVSGGPPAPVEAFHRASWPVESLGNRGTNVRVIQYLLRGRGHDIAVDGKFGPATMRNVVGFQIVRGLRADGVVGRRTWSHLVVPLRHGDRGAEVRALQLLLQRKHRARLEIDGSFGDATLRAVTRTQRHLGLVPTGVVGRQTWRHLVWHFQLPDFRPRSLCDYDTINGNANWGTSATVAHLEAAARRLHRRTGMAVAVGDLGHQHGGEIAGHVTHERGLDVDLRPIRDDGRQCSRAGTFWWHRVYDRQATRDLIHAIHATAPRHVKEILFNDPALVREGLTVRSPGHDDHLHVRYCQPHHRDWGYRC